ncbi:MAG TPA: hypothetical protein VLI71_05150 [Gammaproteobacteria bacterium]|nr:hypothetical protein [Gammaproteobacteria bacterium]
MKASEKVAWGLAGALLVTVLVVGAPQRPAEPGLVIALASYLIGVHWIVAYLNDGTMYGALRLQPSHGLARALLMTVGVVLAVLALQFMLGLGGPFAS